MPTSHLASPSATRAVLASHGLALKKSLGQHFLVDDNIVRKIIELAAIGPDQTVLEIGPGIGTLTDALCDVAAHVVAVERDADLLPALDDLVARHPNLRVVRADAVQVDAVSLNSPDGPPTALVANLPYAVAATVVLRFFQEIPTLASATVMVQSEVADRMAAVPGRKDYGAYTVKLRLLAEARGRFAVPRTCFMPAPRVDSAVLRIERIERDEPAEVRSLAVRLAEAAFAQRRKTLRNSVLAAGVWSAEELDAVLRETGIDGGRRAETLSVEEYLAMAAAMAARGVRA